MKRIKGDRSGLGGTGTLILLIIVLLLLFVGAGVAQPMVMDQKLSPGDTFTYKVEVTGGPSISGDLNYRILNMTLTTLVIEETDYNDVVDTATVDWERDGKMLVLGGMGHETPFDFMKYVLDNIGDFEKTMSFGLIGLTPMAFDVYTGEISGADIVLKTKMGTAIPVDIAITDGATNVSIVLKDTNVCWVSVPMALL